MSRSGTLALENGDKIEGELLSVMKEHVIWQSPVLGKLTVPKAHVVELISVVPMKIRSQKQPCYWAGLESEKVRFVCSRHREIRIPFLLLEQAHRYVDHRRILHVYRGKLRALGLKESGRRERQDWTLDTNIFMRHLDFRNDLWLKYRSESSSTRPLAKRYELTHQFDWFFAPKTFWSTKVRALLDELRLVDRRVSIGTGIGYQFWENKRTALSVETGPEFLEETLYESKLRESKTTDAFSSWRLAVNYRVMLPRDIRFYMGTEALQSLEHGDDWQVDVNTGVSLPIAAGVTADLTFDYDYDNTPQDDQPSRDAIFRVGLGYRW